MSKLKAAAVAAMMAIGAAVVVFGVWLIYMPAGMICAGGAVILGALVLSDIGAGGGSDG